MNRADRRISERNGRALQKRPWNAFEDITLTAKYHTKMTLDPRTSRIKRVWQNSQYTVFWIPRERNFAGIVFDRVMSRRSDAQAICSWADLFRIKNEIFGPEVEAIQFLPKQSELVDDANLYWFFVPSGSMIDHTTEV